ncbi:hypothetical protein GMST_40130 [Geomonas silvestris]|uniref:Right handed beta helix domain-containing protein n=1 Tax=Geomonas silvestris TaxID=2740184 RepID=A0A6V8MNR7_9BACT|nr:hypothetical protein [Geomonas silvestris]GFO61688.1 hypothetical protein GMST_40130 [Geomonas silvestris]
MSFKKHFFVGKIAFLTLLATLLLGSTGFAATYYVDPNGNDTSGNGSSTSPWKTLSTACSKVTTAGNTIYLNAGTYTDNNRCNLAPGVNIQGAGKTLVTITSAYSGGYGTGYIFRETGQTSPVPHGNNDISGFTLSGSNKTLSCGIWLRGTDYNTIHDMKFLKIKSHAIKLAGWTYWTDYNTTANTPPAAWGYNDAVYNVDIDDCTSQTTQATDDRYGAIDLQALSNFKMYKVNINENYSARGTGVKAVPGWLQGFKGYNLNIKTNVYYSDSFVFETYNFTGDSEIYNSTFYQSISLNGGPKSLDSGSSWNLKIHDNTIDLSSMQVQSVGQELSHHWLDFYNNYITGNKGIAAGLWSTNYTTGLGVSHWRFRNNIVYNCADGLQLVRGANSYVEIYNNIFDTMTANPWGGSGIDGSSFSGSLSGAKIQNNLIMNTPAAPISIGSSLTSSLVDHNWFYNTGNGNNVANSSSSTTQSNNTKGVAPQLTGSGARPDPYYRSSTGSNLIDAGVNVGLAYSGSAPDIGAFEGKRLSPPVLSLN